jgi:hypothetical protein
MSRAPAPMPTTATKVADTSMNNPYAINTCGMVGHMPGNGMMGPPTNSPLHAMQNLYGNMQTQSQSPTMYAPQQLSSPAYMHGMQPNTTQNVAVVDFKPDTLINTQIAQLHQQYQNQINSLTATPSLGLIGHDGQYTPATAATAHMPTGHEPYAPKISQHARSVGDDFHSHPHARHEAMTPSIHDLVEASVDRRIGAMPPKPSFAHETHSTADAFHLKSHPEQRSIIGTAVKKAMDDRNREMSMSRYHEEPYNTMSEYHRHGHSKYHR